MSKHTLEWDSETVLQFVRERIPGLPRCESMVGIGLRNDGRLVAGVVYEGINAHNAWMHVAAEPGSRWMTRSYLKVCFAYPFLVCGVRRVSGYVLASNHAARRFDEHLGFKPEATLEGAGTDGSDVIIYRMWREECRYV